MRGGIPLAPFFSPENVRVPVPSAPLMGDSNDNDRRDAMREGTHHPAPFSFPENVHASSLFLRLPHWRSPVTMQPSLIRPSNAARAGLGASRGRSVAARATPFHHTPHKSHQPIPLLGRVDWSSPLFETRLVTTYG